MAEQTVGLETFFLGARRDGDVGHRVVLMTLWATPEAAITAFGGDLSAFRTLDASKHGEQIDRVDYFEVDASGVSQPASPTILRVAAGQVKRGLDADIQQTLRGHIAAAPTELVNAWIGRRVLETNVEIGFFSTWSEAPPQVDLNAAVFPTVSDRYDTFRIEVFEILIQGAGRS